MFPPRNLVRIININVIDLHMNVVQFIIFILWLSFSDIYLTGRLEYLLWSTSNWLVLYAKAQLVHLVRYFAFCLLISYVGLMFYDIQDVFGTRKVFDLVPKYYYFNNFKGFFFLNIWNCFKYQGLSLFLTSSREKNLYFRDYIRQRGLGFGLHFEPNI